MEDNVFEKFKSMINNGNIPNDLQNIISNMKPSSKSTDSSSSNNSISPETISNLMSMLNANNGASRTPPPTGNTPSEGNQQYNDEMSNIRADIKSIPTDNSSDKQKQQSSETSNNFSIDFETIMKFKSIMDKINSKDDPRSKLLISLKPYLKESRKNKIDQYIQFLNMSKVIDVFGKSNGDDKS